MKVSAERIVKSYYPKAMIERWGMTRAQRALGMKPYYLVRKKRGEFMWSGCGDTAAQAWNDAVKNLGLKGLREAP